MSINRTEELSDEELILDFQKNENVKSFEILVYRYKNLLMNFVFRFLGDYETCSDIVQETMIRVFRNKNSYNSKFKFSTWIYTIAGNLAKSELKKRRIRKFLSISKDDDEDNEIYRIPDESARPDFLVDGKIKEELIQKALLKVKELYRVAVILRDIQELSYEEIAEITNTTIGTVKSRINRGRAILQNLLRDIYKEQ